MVEICKMMTLSTAHIRKETADYIVNNELASASSEYMDIIYTHPCTPLADDYPEDLLQCLEFARSHGCDFLRLDRDGEIYSDIGLPIFEW